MKRKWDQLKEIHTTPRHIKQKHTIKLLKPKDREYLKQQDRSNW